MKKSELEELKDELYNVELRLKDMVITHEDFKWLFEDRWRLKERIKKIELNAMESEQPTSQQRTPDLCCGIYEESQQPEKDGESVQKKERSCYTCLYNPGFCPKSFDECSGKNYALWQPRDGVKEQNQSRQPEEEIIKALSGEKIVDIKTITSTEYPPKEQPQKMAEDKERITQAIKEAYEANPPTWANVFNILTKYFEQSPSQSIRPEVTDEEISLKLDSVNFDTSKEREIAYDLCIWVRKQLTGR